MDNKFVFDYNSHKQDTTNLANSRKDVLPQVSQNKENIQISSKQRVSANKSMAIAEKDSSQVKITPEFKKVSFNNNTLVNSFNKTNWFNNIDEKTYYLFNKQQDRKSGNQIFITSNNTLTQNSTKTIQQGKEISKINADWYILPVLLGLITLAFIINAYRKYFSKLYESFFLRYVSKKMVDDKNVSFKRLLFILDFLFVISFSLIIDQILLRFNLYTPPKGYEYILAFFIAIFLLALRLLRFLVFKLSIVFTKQVSFFNDLYVNSLLYTRVLGLILLPLVFLSIYSTNQLAIIFIYISLLALIIVMIFRLIRTIKVFLDNGFSIFYFILYLCALEILPFLVVMKEVILR